MATAKTKDGKKPFPRIDSLKPGTRVKLAFHKGASTTMTRGGRIDEEEFLFVRIEGEGDQRRAVFTNNLINLDDRSQWWSAYRYKGMWAFGSSAERLQLIKVY